MALGLVAAAIVGRLEPTTDELLALGLELEGHGDNLAAALTGGVCLTWGTRIARIADTAPADSDRSRPRPTVSKPPPPERRFPEHRSSCRRGLLRAGRAALLGAALASNSADLFEAALEDRLHEPYRAAESSPVLNEVRVRPPAGALGATLSGARPDGNRVGAQRGGRHLRAGASRHAFPNEQVLPLTISPTGAGPT